jgi:hypothetical protein
LDDNFTQNLVKGFWSYDAPIVIVALFFMVSLNKELWVTSTLCLSISSWIKMPNLIYLFTQYICFNITRWKRNINYFTCDLQLILWVHNAKCIHDFIIWKKN